MIWGTVTIIGLLVGMIWLVARMDRRRCEMSQIRRVHKGVKGGAPYPGPCPLVAIAPGEQQVTVRLKNGGLVTFYRRP